MATAKKPSVLILTIFVALICSTVSADAGVGEDVQVTDSGLKLEFEQLKSKISVLESSIEEKARELKSKDESVLQMEKAIAEKSESISKLQSEVDSLQRKGSVDTEEQIGKAHARGYKLEKQVEKLRKELDALSIKKEALEARTTEAENRVHHLNSKLQELQKINDEQKSRIRKTERALQVAEEEMLKAKLEATSKAKELLEAHGSWLPPWFATHWYSCQSFIATHWNQHGKPTLDVATQKVSETTAQAQKWAEPHLKTVKSRWIPAIKEQWLTFIAYAEPHVHSLTTKTIEVYESSKSTVTPHVVRAQELADPYFQEAKKFTKPYIDNISAVTKPHVDKARVALKPYTKKAIRVYKKVLKSATRYHSQVQVGVQENLNKHELTRPLATKDLTWFVASAALALPVLFLPKLFSLIFGTKVKKPVRSTHTNHTRRRPKRGHSDK